MADLAQPETLARPLALAQALIRRPSVTPEDAGALDVLETALTGLGFACRRMRFEEEGTDPVDNLYARLGDAAPNFCFAGHTDVVPVGAASDWNGDPFSGEVRDGVLYGRGAADMKGAIASFVAAAARFGAARGGEVPGSISLLITGDEEGPAVNGTVKMLAALDAAGERLDVCLVGEPTNPETLGDMVKIGRRGSINGMVVVQGSQGHSAYPQLADNPIPRLARMIHALADESFDAGSEHFPPTTLTFTTVDVGNPATNVIPARAEARFNIRFNDLHSADSLRGQVRARLDAVGGVYDLAMDCTAEVFLTPPGSLSEIVGDAAESVLGRRPELSTTGGTSDARFIKDYCPTAEFGLVGRSMHKVDECVAVEDLDALSRIYEAVLDRFFRG